MKIVKVSLTPNKRNLKLDSKKLEVSTTAQAKRKSLRADLNVRRIVDDFEFGVDDCKSKTITSKFPNALEDSKKSESPIKPSWKSFLSFLKPAQMVVVKKPANDEISSESIETSPIANVKRGRGKPPKIVSRGGGRPRKIDKQPTETLNDENGSDDAAESEESVVKAKRIRSRPSRLLEIQHKLIRPTKRKNSMQKRRGRPKLSELFKSTKVETVKKEHKTQQVSEDDDEFEIEISEEEPADEYEEDGEEEKGAAKRRGRKKKSNNSTQTPKCKSRNVKKPKVNKSDASRWERIKIVLESGGAIEALPGRLDEFDWIKRTVVGLLESSLGGCLYISGVPGTGKTATTHRTLDALSLSALKGECCDFDFVEINGMRLSDPGQAYSILAKTIFRGEKRVPSSGAAALQKLEAHFKALSKSKKAGRPCVVLLDELDLLLRKRQSILYHFFEWPNWVNSQLIVITIANTMDLPERFLSNRISSRLGLTRYNFKPYDHAALANIIEHQLKDYVKYLGKDAIQLCARKVSAVSGDARRAVNLAKRAVDYFRSCSQEELMTRITGRAVEKVAEGSEMRAVNLRLMDIILKDALLANPVEVIGQLSKHQRVMLLSIVLARKRAEEEASLRGGTRIIGGTAKTASCAAPLTVNRVLEQHFQLCRTHQFHPLPSLQELYVLLESLEALRLVRSVKFRESGPEGIVQLLIHEEDIRKGLGDDSALKKYIRE